MTLDIKNTSGQTIWIVNQYAGSPIHGMEYRHYFLAQELIKQGCEVVIISGSFSHLRKVPPETKKRFTIEIINHIQYCWVQTPRYTKSIGFGRLRNMLSFARKLKGLPRNLLPKPNTIIVSSPSMFPAKVMHQLCKETGASFIFEVRDLWPLTLQELGNMSSLHPLVLYMRHFETYAYKHADYVVSLLPHSSVHFEQKGMQAHKFVHIPNGISLEKTAGGEPTDNKDISQLPQNKFIVGYAGTLGTANALQYFIEAARLLEHYEQIHFCIVGNGDQKEALKKNAKSLTNLSFVDAVDKNLVPYVISMFSCCYIGLKKEPLFRFGVSPNKLFDYMLAAKPIIYAVDSSNKPVEEAGCGISVEAEQAQAVANAVIQLFSMSENERTEMGSKGKHFVLENHTYHALAKKYMSLFETSKQKSI
jgi:glycosyltransferase involved in cell wall biosynthesis